jgi:hypothetical protein
MGFDRRDIRRAMDVYTRDNVYLGVVRRIHRGVAPLPEEQEDEGARQSSAVDGESLGPMPTRVVGNPGPRSQAAGARYAVGPDGAEPLGDGALEVGRLRGMVGRRTIPLGLVQSVSFERVILRVTREELERAGA